MSASNRPSTQLLVDGLRRAGLRLTPQRRLVCRGLAEGDDHPTALALYQRLRGSMTSPSQATVYNTLRTLVDLGLAQEIGDAGDGAVHYDADRSPHVNLICTRCHRIENHRDEALEGVMDRAASRSGYELRGARLAYYGLCHSCYLDQFRGY